MATEVADLTASQIDTLLREAEERLAAKNSAAVLAASNKAIHFASSAASAVVAAAPEAGKELAAPKQPKTDKIALRVPQLAQQKKDKKIPDNAGPGWYGMPQTVLTPETKRDFQVLRMRGVLDTKQHFRKDTRKDLYPKFSAFGTVVEGTMEGETARLTRKERKNTIAEEVLHSQAAKTSFKKRYSKIQATKTQGKKAFYKKLVAGRRRRP